MKYKLIKNKKSQIGATLSWIIFYIGMFFLIFIFGIIIWPLMGSISKAISSGTGKVSSQDIDSATFDIFLYFLNSPVEYNGKKTNYKDAILFSINDIDNRELINLIKSELSNYCKQYRLLIPQGLVTEKGLIPKNDPIARAIFSDVDYLVSTWTPAVKYETYYRGEKYEFIYRQLKECNGWEIESKNE